MENTHADLAASRGDAGDAGHGGEAADAADAAVRTTRRTTAAGRRHSRTRERVLREVERRGAATTAELAAATGLHENTVRGHLEQLCRDGHVRREQRRRAHGHSAGRGRPATRWRAVDAAIANPYAGLATTLATTLARTSPQPERAARAAGVAWGEQLAGTVAGTETAGADTAVADTAGPDAAATDAAGADTAGAGPAGSPTPTPTPRTTAGNDRPADAAAARDLVVDLMRQQGFEPVEVDDASPVPHRPPGPTSAPSASIRAGIPLALRRCPLLAAASSQPSVVCAVHEGMIEGIARTRDAAAHARLEPFAAGGVCLLHLGAAS